MSFSPIAGDVPQYQKDADGTAASGFYLKFFAENGTTPILMATDITGGTLLSVAQINTTGNPRTAAGDTSTFIPHINQNYKLGLFPTLDDADNVTNAIWLPDNVPQMATTDDLADATTTLSDDLADGLDSAKGSELIGHLLDGILGVAAFETTVRAQLNLISSQMLYVKDPRFGATGNGSSDDTAAFSAAANAGFSVVYVNDGTFSVDPFTIPSNVMFIGGPGAVIKCRTVTTDFITFLGTEGAGGKGFNGGIQGITINGDGKASWGIKLNSWRSPTFKTLNGQGFVNGFFDIESTAADHSDFAIFEDIRLDFVVGAVTTGRTPRFARVDGTLGTITEYIFNRCTHIGITNNGTLGINASTGVSTDTAGIGVELINCSRCQVTGFVAGNNQDTTVGSWDATVYVQNAGTPTFAFTGSHIINNIYTEQGGSTPTIIATGVIIDANNDDAAKVVQNCELENIKMSRSGSGVTFVDFRHSSSATNRSLSHVYTNHAETLSDVDNVKIAAKVTDTVLHMEFPFNQVVGITNAGVNTRLVPSHEVQTGEDDLVSGQIVVTLPITYRSGDYSLSLSGDENETFYQFTKFSNQFTINSSVGSSTATITWTTSLKVLP